MANSKISALTSATTPLAGTETLPIVQSSTTKKVATNDLTVKNVRSNATTGILQVAGPGTGTTRVMTSPDANFTVARTDAAQSFTGDQTLSTGNLVIGTSGKGIDFSVTPGTGTSELFDDYEEGTWTAIYTADTPPTTPFTMANISATYTKIGRLVTVRAYMQTNNVNTAGASGGVRIAGLPFSAASDEWSVLTIGFASSFAINYPLYGLVRAGTTEVSLLYKPTSFGTNSALALTDLVTGASAGQNQLVVFGQYYAAT